MHARKTARDAYFPTRSDDAYFSARGELAFADTGEARRFAERINERTVDTDPKRRVRPAELAAMVLVHEIFHAVIGLYRERYHDVFGSLRSRLAERLGPAAHETVVAFLTAFPKPAIYNKMREETAETVIRHDPAGPYSPEKEAVEDGVTEELILLWITNQNPAYDSVRTLVSDDGLGPAYGAFVDEARRFFRDDAPAFGPRGHAGESLIDLLLAPSRAAPASILAQLTYIEERWGHALGLDQLALWRRLLGAKDFVREEEQYFHRGGPGPGAPVLDAMHFGHGKVDDEPKRFSADLDWMPHVVLVAKTVFVWLDQLSKKYARSIERLDQIPDAELETLARRGFTGLWLIGLFERSHASKKIKQMRGDADAVASAYSLMKYDIAPSLGGYEAYENLKQRAWNRGLRLAADMVPNHVGIDAEWVVNHPDWFIQASQPPFPGYRFGGPDLSEDARVGIFIEEGYWDETDAAVVFRRHDRQSGEDRFIYHGNDGTSMPWNDTAQLDYTRAEVRRAVIETILHVARMFPIIRFDAAMTLAKRHFSRLWFPLPGSGGAIPSRSNYAMTAEEFDRVFPLEFWREVVDAVRERAPNTLLLAEAFWMMEGYFVRTLGMHRVYNSAFMNMLKSEENEKYRQTIKNVLDFEPEILKRFVNFMNNPDEETAVAQFGSDDKYFGVATLMCTMPGLPMFGHGQVEGLHEKYGMEYRRAKWDESVNETLVERHERELFPLLRKRYLFSGVERFVLYDFVKEGSDGHVDDDVYAYSNGAGAEHALVLYNNKFKETHGHIFRAVPSRRDGGPLAPSTLALGLGFAASATRAPLDWVVFRDLSATLEYLRPIGELDSGFFWAFGAFKYHVLTDFRAVTASDASPYAALAAELDGRGVPSIAEALVRLRFRPLHDPLRVALSSEHLSYLTTGWDVQDNTPTKEATQALDSRFEDVAKGLAFMRAVDVDVEPVKATLRKRVHAILACEHARADSGKAIHARAKLDTPTLLAWAHIDAVVSLIAVGDVDTSGLAIEERWKLALPLSEALSQDVVSTSLPLRRAQLVLLGATLQSAPLREIMRESLTDPSGREFLGVHDANGVEWLVKERFEELAQFAAEREFILGHVSAAMAARQVDDVRRVASKEGYRARRVAKALGNDILLAPPVKPSGAAVD